MLTSILAPPEATAEDVIMADANASTAGKASAQVAGEVGKQQQQASGAAGGGGGGKKKKKGKK